MFCLGAVKQDRKNVLFKKVKENKKKKTVGEPTEKKDSCSFVFARCPFFVSLFLLLFL